MGQPVAKEKPAAPPVAIDPLKRADAAIERLAHIVTAALQITPEPVKINTPPAPAMPRPVRFDAEVKRDDEGRMSRVIITPVYQ